MMKLHVNFIIMSANITRHPLHQDIILVNQNRLSFKILSWFICYVALKIYSYTLAAMRALKHTDVYTYCAIVSRFMCAVLYCSHVK